MPTEDTPTRRPEKPPTDHQFETPLVHETRPAGATHEQRDDAVDVTDARRGASSSETTPESAAGRRRGSRAARP